MKKIITALSMALSFQTSTAQITDLKNDYPLEFQKSKDALAQLLRSKFIIVNPEDNSLRLNLENDSTKSLLEELNDKGLLNEESAAHSPWCW